MRTINDTLIADLMQRAAASPRGRVHHLFHQHPDPVQRLINAMRPGAYFPPHKHEDPDKVEMMCMLVGSAAALQFDDAGSITEIHRLDAAGPVRGVDIPPRVYHAFVALTPAAVLEIIQGPFDPATHKKFAPWAPLEGDPAADAYLRMLEAAVRG